MRLDSQVLILGLNAGKKKDAWGPTELCVNVFVSNLECPVVLFGPLRTPTDPRKEREPMYSLWPEHTIIWTQIFSSILTLLNSIYTMI